MRRRLLWLAAFLPLIMAIGGGRAASTSVIFTPVADAYVNAASPAANSGTSTSLRVDGSPVVRSYIRFAVGGLSGSVAQAVLRVFANSSQSTGYSAYAVSDSTWSETTITYASAPAFATSAAGSSGRVTAQSWTSIDLTSLVTGNGTYNLALTTSNSTALSLASREIGANGPQLVISTAAASVPVNSVLPRISGVVAEGQLSSADPGGWSGSPTSYGYQWRLCSSASDASTCADVAGARNQTYTPSAADVGSYLRVDVSATNSAGTSAPAESQASAQVAAAASVPVSSGLPSITASPQQGQPSSAAPGVWSGSPTSYGHQWRLCSSASDASTCVDIAGARNQTYTPSAADIGSYLRVDVSATNSAGTSAPAESPAVGPVLAAASVPVNGVLPNISGVLEVGQPLRADAGVWSGNPTSYGYQWRLCASPADAASCVDLSGAQGQSYVPAPSDVGSYLRVVVTASNSAGSGAPAESPAVGPVAAATTPDPLIAAAGDIACDPASSSFNGGLGTSGSCRQRATSDLLLGANLTAVLTLGDNAYECGGPNSFAQSFDPTWGRVKSVIRPAVGNHEYISVGTGCTAVAAGYFSYFGAAAGDPTKGYYSYDIGSWHLIALNSNCSRVGGCGAGQPEEQWLRADLAAHQNQCVLAYWHQPHFSSGQHGNDDGAHNPTGAFWQALYDYHADVVLNAHDHDYERFAPQTPSGAPDPQSGIREFVVGTGGKSQSSFGIVQPNSEIRSSGTFGVLLLTLHPTGYDWRFVAEAGKSFSDSGSASCH